MPSDYQVETRRGIMCKWLWVAGLTVFVDLYTKYLATSHLEERSPVEITSFFSLTLSYNKGAAFSFLADQPGWQRWFFVVLTIFVSIMLLVWIYRLKAHERWLSIALSMVLGGAIGNLYDRITLGKVVDFLHFHYFFDFDGFQWDFHYPVFNFADTAICIGAAMLAIDIFRTAKNAEEDESDQREKTTS